MAVARQGTDLALSLNAAAKRAAHEKWLAARKAERQYIMQLRRVARAVSDFVRGHLQGVEPGTPEWSQALNELEQMLQQYSRILQPWAIAVANRMIADVAQRDYRSWMAHSREIGRALAEEIRSAPTGALYRETMARQVDLITSLPLEAAQRVHEIATGQLYSGARAAELRDEIMKTGLVTRSRAELIARTETSRAASSLTEVRARHVGSDSYQWMTAGDADVRRAHRRLSGHVFRWDDPPLASEPSQGMHYHPGQGPNCRCFAAPIIPD